MSDAVLEPTFTPRQARVRAIETCLKWASLVVASAIPVCVVCATIWDVWNVVLVFMGLLAVWTLGVIVYAVVIAAPYVRFSLRAFLFSLFMLVIPLIFLFHHDGFVVVIGFLLLVLWFTLVVATIGHSIWKTHAAMHSSPVPAPPEPQS